MTHSVQLEYKQWLFINHDLYDYFNSICLLKSIKEKQEGTNVIQHWLLVINEDKGCAKYENFPLLSKMTVSDEIAQKLVGAIVEKNFFWRNSRLKSEEAVEKLLLFIDESHNKYQSMIIDFQPIFEFGQISYGEFFFQDFFNLKVLREKFNLDDITTMLLRYESLGNGSYQWGDPMTLHFIYYKYYSIRFEGFASPINSRFLTLPDCRFCSLFPEIDAKFGSLGNFFDIDLTKYPGGWSVNPPFINTVLEDASQKVIAALDAGTKSHYFCTYPLWPDCKGWRLLEDSKYLVKKYHRNSGCVIQDAYGNLIHPPMGLSLFCLSYKSNLNFDRIESFIKEETWIVVGK